MVEKGVSAARSNPGISLLGPCLIELTHRRPCKSRVAGGGYLQEVHLLTLAYPRWLLTYAYAHMYTHIYIHKYMQAYVQQYTHTCTQLCAHIHRNMYTHTYIYHTHTCIHTHSTHMYSIHICTCIHTLTHTQRYKS